MKFTVSHEHDPKEVKTIHRTINKFLDHVHSFAQSALDKNHEIQKMEQDRISKKDEHQRLTETKEDRKELLNRIEILQEQIERLEDDLNNDH